MSVLRIVFLSLLLLPITAFAKQIHLLAMNANTGALKYTGEDRGKIINAFRQHYGRQLQVYEIENVSLAKFQKKIALIATKLRHDDKVVVYFSGHGSIVLDRNKDEGKGDPWDEMLIFAKEQRLIDDDFASYLKPFFKHHLTVILDSCNSGDMTKALGEKNRFIIKAMPTKTPSNTGLFQRQSAIAMLDNAKFKGVLIAAAAADKNALEDQEMGGGVFTHYFAQAFANPRNSLITSFKLAKKTVMLETKGIQEPVMQLR